MIPLVRPPAGIVSFMTFSPAFISEASKTTPFSTQYPPMPSRLIEKGKRGQSAFYHID